MVSCQPGCCQIHQAFCLLESSFVASGTVHTWPDKTAAASKEYKKLCYCMLCISKLLAEVAFLAATFVLAARARDGQSSRDSDTRMAGSGNGNLVC